jgi:L-iditol 2-dehydrogenase
MRAAVYRGNGEVAVEQIPTPEIGPGEVLIRVEACGVCHTDLKKVEYDLLPPPRVYGHETAGVVVKTGSGVSKYKPGDRVIAFHHIPCGNCFYCAHKLYAQCTGYKKVGVTAGFSPAGGGFSQYVRVMDWIVERGMEIIPDGISFEEASLVEPLNTVLKAVIQCDPRPGETVLVMGQGPIGLMFTMLMAQRGGRVVATDTIDRRLQLSRRCGAHLALDPRQEQVPRVIHGITGERGADIVVIAVSAKGIVEQAVECSRPGARIMLFAQTSDKERIELSGASICVGERSLLGSYSASVDIQREGADLIFQKKIPSHLLISHSFPLDRIKDAFHLALHPTVDSLKVIVQPQRCTE